MTIKEQISTDLKQAMRAKDKQQLETMRLINAAVKQIEVDERVEVDDTRMLAILDKLAKQRKESIAQFKNAGRDDLVAQEEFELGIISRYLPTPLTDEEIQTLIDHALAATDAKQVSDMGKVMAILKPKMQGRADMSQVSSMVKSQLA